MVPLNQELFESDPSDNTVIFYCIAINCQAHLSQFEFYTDLCHTYQKKNWDLQYLDFQIKAKLSPQSNLDFVIVYKSNHCVKA